MNDKKTLHVTGADLRSLWERLQSLRESPIGEHLSVEMLKDYCAGRLLERDFAHADEHLASCPLCADTAEELDMAASLAPQEDSEETTPWRAGEVGLWNEVEPWERPARQLKLVVDELLEKASPVPSTLFVGLGGCGCRMVARVARHLQSQPDFGEHYRDLVKFVLVDTNVNDLESYGEIADETFLLSDFDKEQYAGLALDKLFLEADPYFTQWMPLDYRFRAQNASGAGQIRLESRLGLYYQMKHKDLVPRCDRLLEALEGHQHSHRRLDSAEIRIVVCYSVAGGTGSGCHLPIAYMLRDHARNLGKPQMIGVAVLPAVFEEKTGINRDGTFANGYAALKEMEHLMKLGAPESRFYPDNGLAFHYDPSDESKRVVRERPFDLLYVIDKPEPPSISEPVDAAADGLYLQLFSPLFGTQARDYINALHQRFLVPHDFEGKGIQGFSTFYGSYGAAVLLVPMAGLVDYCARAAALNLIRGSLREKSSDLLDALDHDQRNRIKRMIEESDVASTQYVLDAEALQIEDGRRVWDFYFEDRIAELPELSPSHSRVQEILREFAIQSSLSDGELDAGNLGKLFTALCKYAAAFLRIHIGGDYHSPDAARRGGLTLVEALELEVVYRALYHRHLAEIQSEPAKSIRQLVHEYRSLPNEAKEDLGGPKYREYLRDKVRRVVDEKVSLLCSYDESWDQQGSVRPDYVFLAVIGEVFRGTRVEEAILGVELPRLHWITEGWHNPREIVFYRAVLNVPLYVFGRMERMKNAYEAFKRLAKRSKTLHIDKNWEEGLADLDPVSAQEKHRQERVRNQIINFSALFITRNPERLGHGFIVRREGKYFLCDPSNPGEEGLLTLLGENLTDAIEHLPDILETDKVKYLPYQRMLQAVHEGLSPKMLSDIVLLPIQWRRNAEELRRTLYGSRPTPDELLTLKGFEDSYRRLYESLEGLLERLRNREVEQMSLGEDASTKVVRVNRSQSVAILHAFRESWKQMENPEDRDVPETFRDLLTYPAEDNLEGKPGN